MLRRFKNRHEAGRRLAEHLLKYADREDVVVLGLPRGGVPVAFEIAKRLRAVLEIFVVRKLGFPHYPELAMGAIATGGIRVINQEVVEMLGIPLSVIESVEEKEKVELERRELAYRGHTPALKLDGRIVILVDDGIATGATMKAAISAIRTENPTEIIVAVPPAPPSTYWEVSELVDEVISLMLPENFETVGEFYEDFSETSDDEVRELIAEANAWKVREERNTLQSLIF